MKRLMLLTALPLCATAIHGEGLYVGYKESAKVDVPAETSETRAPVYVDGNGTLDKTGAGELRIPLEAIWQNNPFAARVREGSLTLTGDAAPTFETPTETLDKAAFWVHAGKGLVVSNGTYVYEWNDAREDAAKAGVYDAANPVTGRQYLYAKAQWDLGHPENKFFGIAPDLVTRSGNPMLSFNGQGASCQFMRWMNPDGTKADVTGITDMFVVLDCDKSFGQFVSSGTDPNDMQAGYSSDIGMATYFSSYGNSAPVMHDNAVFCRDGRRVSITTAVSRGVQVLDFRFEFGRRPHAGVFFGERPDKVTKPGDLLAGREGGDYIAEAIVFTNLLTACERMMVQQYLLRKYGKTGQPSASLTVADDAKVSLSVATGSTSQLGETISVVGRGQLAKTGGGTLVVGQETSLGRGLAIEEGKLRLRSPSAVVVAAGDTVTTDAPTGVSAWSAGTEVTRTTASGSDKVTKGGTGFLQVDGMPDDVKSLEVAAGTLSLGVHPPVRSAVFDPAYPTNETRTAVTIANWGFEDAEGVKKNSGINYSNRSKNIVQELDWYSKMNGDTDVSNGGVGFCSTVLTKDDHSQGGGPNWPTGGYDAPEGNWVLCLKSDATAWTFVTVEEAGLYELSFKTGARAGTHDIEVYMGIVAEGDDDVDVDALLRVGTVQAIQNPFAQQKLKTMLQPGRTAICFRLPTLKTDRVAVIDDVHLTHVVRETGKIPNGDFELTFNAPTETTRETKLVGWEIDTEGTFPDAKQYDGITPCVTDSRAAGQPRFYPSEDALYGKMGLFFYGTGGVARTTFTPPAGTWKLACRARRWGTNMALETSRPAVFFWLGVSAVLKTGAATTDLGTITEKCHYMEDQVWDTPFVADGQTKVTLELRQTQGLNGGDLGCGVIDDLDLVPADTTVAEGDELIANGSFETGDAWTYDKNNTVNGNTSGKSTSQPFAEGKLWGAAEGFDGKNTWRVTQIGQATQPLTVPEDGIYRLSFRTLSRHDGLDMGFDPIQIWLEANGTKTVIARTEVVTTNFCKQVFYVRLKAGAYTFGLQGENDVSVTGYSDRSSLVDCVSLKRVGWMEGQTPDVPKNLEVKVAAGAKLSLDFGGQLKLGRLRLGGRAVSGEISAAKRPDLAPYLSGPGEVYVEPRGLFLIVR